ncbi:MAG: GAF domain-containing sensor histidine kinase [Elusimicrobia bacterium]|nr:GAF domain-containing sensor histidine kinase [Elusimicrobiota bacterium]
MSELAWALVGASAAFGVYWWRRLAQAGPSLGEGPARHAGVPSSRLAQELLASARLPSDPVLFDEILRSGADRLLSRAEGLSMAVWKRGEGGDALVYRTGALAGLSSDELRLSERHWESAASLPRGVDWRGNLTLLSEPAAARGLGAARVLAWGGGNLRGLLVAAEPDAGGRTIDSAGGDLDLLAAHFGAAAALALSLWEMQRSKKRLEGGLTTLHEVASTIAAPRSGGGDSLSAVVSIVAKALNADLCAFLLYDEKAGELVVQPGAYGLSGDEGSLYRLPLDKEEASSVRVFRSGIPFMTGDALNDPRVVQQYARLWKCHSLIVVPLTLEGRRIGVLRVGSFQRGFFSPEQMEFVQLLAEEAVVVLESAMLTRKLEETNQRLGEVNRIKDDFVSTVSHEFKTPLTSIKGFTTVMLEETAGPLTLEQKRFLTIIANACDRLTMLVGDLLDIARLEGGARMEFGPVSLVEALRHCREVHQWQADGRSIEFRVEFPEGLPSVRGDGRWLRQVLDNLVSNAIKFTPPGGQVTVAGRERGDAVELTVSDTGVGIAPEDQGHIFEKFYRARNRATVNAPGTGLGLAIAKAVVEKHEGKIWFESEAGRGTTFHVLLPASVRPGDPQETVSSASESH